MATRTSARKSSAGLKSTTRRRSRTSLSRPKLSFRTTRCGVRFNDTRRRLWCWRQSKWRKSISPSASRLCPLVARSSTESLPWVRRQGACTDGSGGAALSKARAQWVRTETGGDEAARPCVFTGWRAPAAIRHGASEPTAARGLSVAINLGARDSLGSGRARGRSVAHEPGALVRVHVRRLLVSRCTTCGHRAVRGLGPLEASSHLRSFCRLRARAWLAS
eukprot:Amastigsp_a339868_139.p3 type:complete len:220 gc:universal Amastigsp_a339868_139:1374-715(-)